MARRDKSLLQLDAVRVEGGIIQPDVVASVARGDAEWQSSESYGILPGLNLRDEIGRAYQIGRAQWAQFESGRDGVNPDAVHQAFAHAILTAVLGFSLPNKKRFASTTGSTLNLLDAKGGHVPIAVAGAQGIDQAEAVSSFDGIPVRRSATTLVQGELNAREECLWGIATNGSTWRILRDNESITRPGYVEIDLARVFRDDLYADFTAFWMLTHHSRFGADDLPGSECILEQWRDAGRKQGVTVREDLRDGVQKALFHFGRGFLENPDNLKLVGRLNDPGEKGLSKDAYFKQLLRLVYRLIFVMTAEDRDILHAPDADDRAKAFYAEGYATGRFRDRSRNKLNWDRHHDAYEGMKVVFRSLGRGEPRLALPPLGGIFAAEQTPDLDKAVLANKRFLQGLYHLSWLRRDGALVRINWRDMETEEFGSVYESLLELTPVVSGDGKSFSFLGEPDEDKKSGSEGSAGSGSEKPQGGAKGNERKKTGSYYTPDSLVKLLLDQALDPVIKKTIDENPGNPEALLKLKVIDIACGSGHFVLGAARRIARKLADLRHEGSPSLQQYRHAMRDVGRHCLYGVDRNPMAIELCKVAIWIETVEPGKPLTFIDQKLRCGDSLVGIYDFSALAKGIPDEAYATLSGDVSAAASHFKKLNRLQRDGDKKNKNQRRLEFMEPPQDLIDSAKAVELMPEDDLAEIAKKKKSFESFESSWKDRKFACDLWTAAFFTPKREIPPTPGLCDVPLTDHVWLAWGGSSVPEPLRALTEKIAEDAAFLHWPIVFADVMKDGGFDCVIGNPPWEVVQLSNSEYFSSRVPEIAALKGIAQKAAIEALREDDTAMFDSYLVDKRFYDACNAFARASCRFILTACGKINTYALFSELFACIKHAKGNAGLIVPTGIATDYSNRFFFEHHLRSRTIVSFFMFDNQRKIFPSIHSDTPFGLLTLGSAHGDAEFAAYLLEERHLQDAERRYYLSADDIARINPNTKTAPIFRTKSDAALTAKIYERMPLVLPDNGKPPFAVELIQNFFSGSNAVDAKLFSNAALLNVSETYPVYRGTMVDQFDDRAATFERATKSFRPLNECEKESTEFSILSDKRIPKKDVHARLADKGWSREWLIGWRDITNATNERTVIASAIPVAGADDTFSIILPLDGAIAGAMLLANLNSLVLDYVAQQKVGGTHIRKYVISQFPIVPPSAYTSYETAFVISRVVELVYTSNSISHFARELGYDGSPFTWNENRRAVIIAELDAFYARAYGLTRDELRYILDPSDIKGKEYPSETFRGLKNKDLAKYPLVDFPQYAPYYTASLVLDAWDRMERGELAA